MKYPLLAFRKNVVFNEKGEAFAIYRLGSSPYYNLPKVDRQAVIRRFEQLIWGLEGKGQILFLNEEMYLDEKDYLATAGALPTQEAIRHAQSVRKTLTAGARNRRKYLVLQLQFEFVEAELKIIMEEIRERTVGTFLGQERWLLSEDRLSKALEAEKELYQKIFSYVDGRITFADLDFIHRRLCKRIGALPPPLASRDGGKFTPAIVTAFSEGAMLTQAPTHIKITSGLDEVHYQTFITFPDLPKVIPEIGAEWLASLDAWDISIDACVHIEVTKPHKAKKKTRDRRKFLKGQMRESLGADDETSLDEEYGFEEGRYLEGKLSSGQPLVAISTVLAVASDDLKTMRANAKRVLERYNASGYRVVRPIGDQLNCFYSFIPGSSPAAPSIQADPGFLAAAGSNVSFNIGDQIGFFLGWSGASPVFYKPGYAAQGLDRSNAMFISGALGGGKSLTIKYLLYLAYLSGAYLFILDPKNNEYAVLEELFPIQKIDLCPGGKMQFNPFVISSDTQQAKSIIYDYLSIALNLREDNDLRRIVISNAIEKVYALPPEQINMYSCLQILDEMAQDVQDIDLSKEAGKCAMLLKGLQNSSLGYLVFGTETAMQEAARVTVVNLQGLPLPRTADSLNKGNVSESERQGLGLLYLAAAMAREVAFNLPPDIVKYLVFDEAWMLLNISEGRRVIDEIIRMAARTFGAVPILATQNTTDVLNLQTIKNNISYVLCFRAQDDTEITTSLDLIGADKEEAAEGVGLANMFPGLKSGWCIMRDALGRIGRVYIDPQPGYLLEVFDTSPNKQKNRQRDVM